MDSSDCSCGNFACDIGTIEFTQKQDNKSVLIAKFLSAFWESL